MKLNQKPLTLLKRFWILFGAVIFLSAISAQLFFARQERTNLETRLREKAAFINNFYAFLIADALVRKDDVTLLQVVNRLEEDREIFSVVVVDQQNRVRYHIMPEKMGTTYEDPAISNTLKNGEATIASYTNSAGKAIALITPLRVQGAQRPLGVIRIDMTFRVIDQQVAASGKRYWFVVLGTLTFCFAFITGFINRWVMAPLQRIRTVLSSINTAQPEAALPEPADEIGEVNAAINELLVRFKNELQHQSSTQKNRGEQEKAWIRQLMRSFMPEARWIVADKDNRVISDSENGAAVPPSKRHLMDLIKETNFATLLSTALQQEGEVVRGPVTFQEKNYQASILSVPAKQSIAIKTLIALQPN